MKHIGWHTWRQSSTPSTYKLRTTRQLCYTFIHWHFHSNPNPPTDRETVSFRSSCILHTSKPRIIARFLNIIRGPSDACVAAASQIRLSAILLLLTVGKWNLRCFGGLQMYDVIYRYSWFNRWSDRTYTHTHTHTHTVRQYKQHNVSLSGKESIKHAKF